MFVLALNNNNSFVKWMAGARTQTSLAARRLTDFAARTKQAGPEAIQSQLRVSDSPIAGFGDLQASSSRGAATERVIRPMRSVLTNLPGG